MDDRHEERMAVRGGGAADRRLCRPRARSRGARPRLCHDGTAREWPAIVGAELAQFTMPDRVVWPRHRDDEAETASTEGQREEGAILVLRVEGPRAIEVQHRSGQILERVNGYFGYRAVAEMRILQAPVAREARPPRPPRRQPIDPQRFPLRPPSKMGLERAPCCGSARRRRKAHKRLSALSRSCHEGRCFNECRPDPA